LLKNFRIIGLGVPFVEAFHLGSQIFHDCQSFLSVCESKILICKLSCFYNYNDNPTENVSCYFSKKRIAAILSPIYWPATSESHVVQDQALIPEFIAKQLSTLVDCTRGFVSFFKNSAYPTAVLRAEKAIPLLFEKEGVTVWEHCITTVPWRLG
jgi:hypothetical protein